MSPKRAHPSKPGLIPVFKSMHAHALEKLNSRLYKLKPKKSRERPCISTCYWDVMTFFGASFETRSKFRFLTDENRNALRRKRELIKQKKKKKESDDVCYCTDVDVGCFYFLVRCGNALTIRCGDCTCVRRMMCEEFDL